MHVRFRSFAIGALVMMLSGCEALMFASALVGCAAKSEPTLMPLELPMAKVGAPYRARVDVICASSPVSQLLVAPALPLPEGLAFSHEARDKHGVIQGTPTKAGTYDVRVYGNTFGTQCTGQNVERLYKFEVKQ
ncbi:putative Ig domain-containing protein [Pseudomonas sp.]|uniref:putative Ig domain-containing protein n=1 Tax=Pseudomonas sp. TaxID=306 RepID=UPI002B6E3D18|nr:putative Ig domain-containing protein [Pseudomonas sp.]HUE90778.1 putative Ig domain-containing protein [Pseudomonas sp.]